LKLKTSSMCWIYFLFWMWHPNPCGFGCINFNIAQVPKLLVGPLKMLFQEICTHVVKNHVPLHFPPIQAIWWQWSMPCSRSFHIVKMTMNISMGIFQSSLPPFNATITYISSLVRMYLMWWHCIMKYTTKNQNEFKSIATLHLNAFNKHVHIESNLFNHIATNIKGCHRISNMVCFISSKQEIMTSMACTYLLQDGPLYESCHVLHWAPFK